MRDGVEATDIHMFVGPRLESGKVMAVIVGKTKRSEPAHEVLTFRLCDGPESASAWFAASIGEPIKEVWHRKDHIQ